MKENQELIRAARIHSQLSSNVKISDIEKTEKLARAHIYYYRDLHNLSDQLKGLYASGLMALKPLITAVRNHGEENVSIAIKKIDALRAQQIQSQKRSKDASKKISEKTLNEFISGMSSSALSNSLKPAPENKEPNKQSRFENTVMTKGARIAVEEIRNILIAAGSFSQELSTLTLSISEHEQIIRRLSLFEQFLDDIDGSDEGEIRSANSIPEETNQDIGSYVFESLCDPVQADLVEDQFQEETNYEDYSQDPADYFS